MKVFVQNKSQEYVTNDLVFISDLPKVNVSQFFIDLDSYSIDSLLTSLKYTIQIPYIMERNPNLIADIKVFREYDNTIILIPCGDGYHKYTFSFYELVEYETQNLLSINQQIYKGDRLFRTYPNVGIITDDLVEYMEMDNGLKEIDEAYRLYFSNESISYYSKNETKKYLENFSYISQIF